jgi:protocatechuate 3,4-dioxygenase beta subunit
VRFHSRWTITAQGSIDLSTFSRVREADSPTDLLAPFRPVPTGVHPPHLHEPYVASIKRAPQHALIAVPQGPSETLGPRFDWVKCSATCDMSTQGSKRALGQRIVVSGSLLDEDGRPQADQVIEIWQANAAGRYLHKIDQHDAPLDPNFSGAGIVRTDREGRFRFLTIKPGAYPWGNHHNAWRPAHIHFSLFGPSFSTRLVTQMYFPDDPLIPLDPIYNCTADENARKRLISSFDLDTGVPHEYLGFRFDMVLRGRKATPWENR